MSALHSGSGTVEIAEQCGLRSTGNFLPLPKAGANLLDAVVAAPLLPTVICRTITRTVIWRVKSGQVFMPNGLTCYGDTSMSRGIHRLQSYGLVHTSLLSK